LRRIVVAAAAVPSRQSVSASRAGGEEGAPVTIRITDEAMTSDTTPHNA
jgi:hypothetical protein